MSAINDRVSAAIAACREAVSVVSERAQAYVDQHDRHLEATVMDSSFIKSRMKERIARVYDGD